ncbi:MAG TPA: hypothetical protein PLV92_22815, partial [Pirellulaceae bacterium]|nr:hypothetical protein [Pirellulaceae bacterium]
KDERLLDELRRELLEQADPQFLKLIIAALSPKADVCAEELWGILQSSDGVAANRFRAALALASFEPASSRWSDADFEFVVRELLRQNPEQQPALRELLRPLRKRLADAAESAFANAELADSERVAAANLVVDFLHDEPDRLARLSVLADSNQFKILFKPLEEERQATVEVLTEIARTAPEVDWTDDARILRGRKRAHAAAGLLRLGLRDSLPSALRFSDDLEAPTQFARNFRGRGIGPSPIVESIGDCAARRAKLTDGARRVEDGVLYGLLLALGEFKLDDLTREQQSRMLQDLEHWYRDDPSAAVHGAAGWLLRRWGREEDARRIDSRSVPFDANREWFTVAVRRPAGSAAGATSGEAGAADAAQSGRDDEASFHFTFVVIPAGTYAIGSPLGQAEREDPETPHTFRLVRPIAVLDREVTRAEFLASGQTFDGIDKFWNTIEHPILGANWYEAVRFCRWLTTQTGIAETEQAYPDPASLDVERYPRESLLGGTSAPRDWP